MIRLNRPVLPAAASQRLLERREQLHQLLERGASIPDTLAKYYRTARAIKEALSTGTHHKCMYCESAVTHVYHGAVEHVVPRAHAPELTLTYENMGFCCGVCNTNKLDFFDQLLPLLDPYQVDPSQHISSRGPSLIALSDVGSATITVLRLNRAPLLFRRHERFERVEKLIRAFNQAPVGAKKALLGLELRRECELQQEFSLVTRNHILAETGMQI